MKQLLSTALLGGFLLFLVCCCDQPTISLESLLIEMADRKTLTRFPSPDYELKQVSSYNPASVKKDSAGWFANFDMSHFHGVTENRGRREFILFDVAGPGAIVRWWMTFYLAGNGIIRIYLDNAQEPVIEGTPDELLSGDLLAGYPFSASVQEGAPVRVEGWGYDHNFYLPIPFSKHARITYENDTLVQRFEYEGEPVPGGYWWPDVFYNIGYRKYAPGTSVESFSRETLRKSKDQLASYARELTRRPSSGPDVQEFNMQVHPGDSLVLEFAEKNYAVRGLTLRLKSADLNQALRSTVITACFDGNCTVWVPVGEFFGLGYIPAAHETWMNRSDEGGLMESWWVMPFRENCRISFINFGKQEVYLSGEVVAEPYDWKPGTLYFGAAWHEYHNINSRDDSGSPFDLNFIRIEGRGVYAGDQVTLFNNTWHWWGEGDEKIYVDGESFPSSFGTGSEDYYGYSFGRPDPFSHPFVAQPVGTGNTAHGVTVNMRQRSLDAIPFDSSIQVDIELWHWDTVRMNYALTTYWYAEAGQKINVKPDIKSVQQNVVLKKEDLDELQFNP